MLGYSLTRKFEDAEVARNLTEFGAIPASFFVANRERCVRRLCVHSQYLLSPILDYVNNLEDFKPDLCLEGQVESLQLLHVCLEQPECIKYQMLFASDEAAVKYRRAFFAKAGHRNG